MDGSGFLGDQPSRWQFYVEVADTDATVAQAVAHGRHRRRGGRRTRRTAGWPSSRTPRACLFAVVRSQQG